MLKFFSASLSFGIGALLAKFASLLKDSLVARQFGLSDDLDAFLLALLMPSLLVNLAVISFANVFIPRYITRREHCGQASSKHLLGSGLFACIAIALLVTVTFCSTMPFWLRYFAIGFSPEKLALTQELALQISPMILLTGITAFYSNLLNSEGSFFWSALSTAVLPLAVILVLVVSGPALGVHALVIGTLVGLAIQTLIVMYEARQRGLLVLPALSWHSPDMRLVFAQYRPAVAGAALMAGTEIINQAVASTLPSGSISALGYGNKIVALVATLTASAVAAAALPHFATLVATQTRADIRKTVLRYSLIVFGLVACAALLLISLSDQIVRHFFEYGQFTSVDTKQVSLLQQFYALQLPFFVVGMMFVRLLNAMHLNKLIMLGSLGNLVVCMILSPLLASRYGAVGLAASTSIVYIASFCFLGIAVRFASRENGRTEDKASFARPPQGDGK